MRVKCVQFRFLHMIYTNDFSMFKMFDLKGLYTFQEKLTDVNQKLLTKWMSVKEQKVVSHQIS